MDLEAMLGMDHHGPTLHLFWSLKTNPFFKYKKARYETGSLTHEKILQLSQKLKRSRVVHAAS